MPPKMLDVQPDRDKGTKILAKSIYRELRGQGYTARQIVALSTELIGLVTNDIPRDAALLEPETTPIIARG